MAEQPSDPRLYEKYAADPAVYAEVMSFADYLGFDLHAFPDLYWIAEQARSAPIPEAWTEHVDESGNSYYYNEETDDTTWEAPPEGVSAFRGKEEDELDGEVTDEDEEEEKENDRSGGAKKQKKKQKKRAKVVQEQEEGSEEEFVEESMEL